MNHPATKAALSKPQSRLVELLQQINFGRIERLHVKGGVPVFDPPPLVIQKLKMGGDNGPRPEADLADFLLKRSTVELLETIAGVGNGEVRSIEIKNGLAFAVEVELRGGGRD